ncbi:hypothetical protein [Pyrolobus fumarii]|uniref:hypothetical protein n=1 Tax=Pyrolobus fumarii TaxID=54252 RepID=UPI0014334773|nr:hypothetical protein [Pyrolobus fumarii]
MPGDGVVPGSRLEVVWMGVRLVLEVNGVLVEAPLTPDTLEIVKRVIEELNRVHGEGGEQS